LRNKVKTIYESGGISKLFDVWYALEYEMAKGEKKNFLDEIREFEDFRSSKIISDLYHLWPKMYNDIIEAIERNDNEKLENTLKNIESIYLKSVINGDDVKFGSPLHYAVFTGNLEATKILLRYGASQSKELDTVDSLFLSYNQLLFKSGCLPLHIAATTDNKEIFNVLLENGSDIDVRDRNGQTALLYAAMAGKIEMLDYILQEKHSNPSIEDNDGNTFLDYIEGEQLNILLDNTVLKEKYPELIEQIKNKQKKKD